MTVVPIYNMVVAPNARTFMQTDLYKRLTGKDPEENEQVVLLIARKQALLSEMRQIDFYPIGVSGRIAEINQNGYLVFKTGDRVNVENLSIIGGERIELEAIPKPDIEDLDAEDEKSRLEVLKSKLVESVKDFRWGGNRAKLFHADENHRRSYVAAFHLDDQFAGRKIRNARTEQL